MDTAQLLLTRFNITSGFVPDPLGLNEKWLEHRFALFENFCLPSVLAQRELNFYWLILMDARTPERWMDRLKEALKPLPLARILTADRYTGEIYVNEIKRIAAERSVTRVVTTRLDNDDAIANDYMANILSCALKQSPDKHFVINFRNGCQLRKDGLFAVSFKVNAFLSMVSPVNDLKTCLHTEHGKMDEVAPVIEPDRFGQSFSWLQVIHDTNYANEVNRKSHRIDAQHLNSFTLGKDWKRALELDCVPVDPKTVGAARFAFRSPIDKSQTDIVLHGLEGDRLFDKVRRSRAFYDVDLLEFVSFLLSRDCVVMDVGARFGNDSVFFGKIVGAKVLAFESHPESLRLLKLNIAENGLAQTAIVREDAPAVPGERISMVKIACDSHTELSPGVITTIQRDRPFVMVRTPDAELLRAVEDQLRRLGYVRSNFFSGTSTVLFGPSIFSFWKGIARRRLARTFRKFKR